MEIKNLNILGRIRYNLSFDKTIILVIGKIKQPHKKVDILTNLDRRSVMDSNLNIFPNSERSVPLVLKDNTSSISIYKARLQLILDEMPSLNKDVEPISNNIFVTLCYKCFLGQQLKEISIIINR
ncbi:hypothetical protein BpHYR1_004137 [Brachionus plicatilis]|uniref:Uncharacterized protein n=1 Tax=Brachionus plicatilis TaxID=10195 RepID=A0A3M7QHP2_BRAPC|nr:hypothetical protein BpHYR1_004137 [Brachionus plicatilis]